MFISLIRFFDKLEDRIRSVFSRSPIIYAFIGGATHVIFWRGIWITSDIIRDRGGFIGWLFYEPVALVWASLILLLTGLFVAGFIGERVIISGVKKEKKITEKSLLEIKKEEEKIDILNSKIDFLLKEITNIKNDLAEK